MYATNMREKGQMPMNGTALALMMALLFSVVAGTRFFDLAQAQSVKITIKVDGSITPLTAPIITADKITYNFTGNITGEIRIERSNITIDGNGYSYQRAESGFGLGSVNNVSIRNINGLGLYLTSCTNCSIYDNNITTGIGLDFSDHNDVYSNNVSRGFVGISLTGGSSYNNIYDNSINGVAGYGIDLFSSCRNNKIHANNITNNKIGIYLWESCSNNEIFLNNFVNNTLNAEAGGLIGQCYNFWDNGSSGNYWGDYNGTDLNRDGIGDTPYKISDAYKTSADKEINDTDNYPLMAPYNESVQSKQEPEQFQTALVVALSALITFTIVGICLLVYFKRRKR